MKNVFCLFVLLFPSCLFAQSFQYEPKARSLTRHKHYSLDFDTLHRQARWVYYMLTFDSINGKTARGDNFRPDPFVPGCPTLADYRGSGYDRGHLCPAADMKISQEAMSETFFLSNMSPQAPAFNRGAWAKLEALVRSYIRDNSDTLYVVTGPVFLGATESIGESKVTVPLFYYKAVYCPKRGMTAFLMPNRKIGEPLSAWVVSVDVVEALTGIDFFPQLPPEVQDELEPIPKFF